MRMLETSSKNGYVNPDRPEAMLLAASGVSDKSVGMVIADTYGGTVRFHAAVGLHPDDMRHAVNLAASGVFVFNL